ncbi:MAG: YraN family protein [Alphaproteobacteria bacterium]|nr:YraN family protein [Alphaproteobacteria bacterium]
MAGRGRREALQAGAEAEDFVAARLVAGGARVLARRWSGGGGELDLVVERAGRLRFVEVKARADDVLDPLEQITPAKQARLVGAARAWLRAHATAATEVAFLVAVVDLSAEPWQVSWVDDAFDVG